LVEQYLPCCTNGAILDQHLMTVFRYFAISITGRAHFPNTCNTVQKRINIEYIATSVAMAVRNREADNAANTMRYILLVD
jgi:hypothetical protein